MSDDMSIIASVWSLYYEKEPDVRHEDKRVILVRGFVEWFREGGKELLNGVDWRNAGVVYFSYEDFKTRCPYSDFSGALREEPDDVLRCLGIALCVIRADVLGPLYVSMCVHTRIQARMQAVTPLTAIRDLKSNSVGKFVSIRGNVVRVSAVRPLVLRLSFHKSFIPLYATARTIDWQKLRVQEPDVDASDAGRVPRCVDVEAADDLVDAVVPGDVVTVGGIVKAIETDVAAGKGTARAKSLFLLYVDARSVSTHKGEDRGTGGTGGAAGGAAGAADGVARNGISRYFSERDMEFFARVKLHADPFSLLVASACPQIFGHEMVKAGLLLGVFGGTPRNVSNNSIVTADSTLVVDVDGLAADGGVAGVGQPGSVRSAVESAVAELGSFDRPSNKLHVRSDPHVLVVGDPGMGKSQMLQAISALAPRGVYVCGNTTSTTGLTVTMVRDAVTGDYGLEAGALVLGDQGVVAIDEFDKMTAEHSALLEAMEQQRISIAKAGIVSSLSARTSVLAAANPVGGHYNKGKTIMENLRIPAPLLSRFDLVFILLDKPDDIRDRQLSEHVMAMHDSRKAVARPGAAQSQSRAQLVDDEASQPPAQTQAAHARAITVAALRETQQMVRTPSQVVPGLLAGDSTERAPLDARLRRGVMAIPPAQIIPPMLLRKYVAYARKFCLPALTPEAAEVLQAFYLKLRKQHGSNDSTPITTRQLEALIRLAEARAKIELRDVVTRSDAEDVVEMMKESLFEAVTDDFGVVDFGKAGGMSMGRQVKLFVAALSKASTNRGSARFTTDELERFARDMRLQLPSFNEFLDILNQQSYIIRKGPREWQLLSG